jgi:tetratricopeptide (TPR) repeat protein
MRAGFRQFFPAPLTTTVLLALLLAASVTLIAQPSAPAGKDAKPGAAAKPKNNYGAELRITVVDASGNPIERQALIKLHSVLQDTTDWQITTDKSQSLFEDVLFGKYDIEASALGYLSSNAQINISSSGNTVDLKMTLPRDVMVELEESDASLPSKTLHELHRAIRALSANDLSEAQKRLEEADRLSPASSRVKFLLGYLFFAKGDFEQAQTSLVQATTYNPHDARALSLLGRVYLIRGQPALATAALEKAVVDSPDNWITHYLLSDAYLQQHEYEKAHDQAALALVKSDGEGTAAQLSLGQSLAGLGRQQEAIQALKTFLKSSPKSTAAPHAQELLKKLEQHKSKPGEVSAETLDAAAAFNPATDLLTSPKSDLPTVSWLPANIDRTKPPVVTGLSCPSQQVIDGAGDHVREMVTNVEKFAAVESIVYEKRDNAGTPNYSETHKFDYAAAVSQQKDVVLVDEYRVQRYDMDTLPDRIVDNGFAVLALVFHPVMRDAFKMTCEGLGELHGKPTWLVRFQQREDRPNHMQAYLVGTVRYPVSLKGRAWIMPDTLQIARIESDMVTPMPMIELLAEHTVTEYAPVPFPKKDLEFWLPQSAEVYMYFRGQRYYRKHSFEKYLLFYVEAQDKVNQAKHDPEAPAVQDPETPTTHDPG